MISSKPYIEHYVTLFNEYYFTRGLAMMESLFHHCKNIHITVICFDEDTFQKLSQLHRSYIYPVSLSDFEIDDLKQVKKNRSLAEYCWTCTPFSIAYVLDHLKVESCTYLDADLYFFASPEPLITEMGDQAVLITPHRYTPIYDQSQTAGIYCVQFMRFTNTETGLKALRWWQAACLEWCYNRFEDGKFGDQKYLDDWPTHFEKVHVLQHLGGGLAPWNIQQYELSLKDGQLLGQVKSKKENSKIFFPLIFYHFHQLRHLGATRVDAGLYRLSKSVHRYLYGPYIQHLHRLAVQFDLLPKETSQNNFSFITFLKNMKRRWQGTYNIRTVSIE